MDIYPFFSVTILVGLFSNEVESSSAFITVLHVSLTFHIASSTGVKYKSLELRNIYLELDLDK